MQADPGAAVAANTQQELLDMLEDPFTACCMHCAIHVILSTGRGGGQGVLLVPHHQGWAPNLFHSFRMIIYQAAALKALQVLQQVHAPIRPPLSLAQHVCRRGVHMHSPRHSCI